MRFAICDDVRLFLIHLTAMIQCLYLNPDEQLVIEEFSSGEELVDSFSAGQYDAIILDIEMKEMSGLDTADAIRQKDADVIIAFHTSFEEIDAANHHFGKYMYMQKGQSANMYRKQFSMLFSNCIRNTSVIQIAGIDISLREIMYFQGNINGTLLYDCNRVYELPISLKEIESNELLTYFTKTHRNYYINEYCIYEILSKNIRLKNGETIPLTAKYRQHVLDDFNLCRKNII